VIKILKRTLKLLFLTSAKGKPQQLSLSGLIIPGNNLLSPVRTTIGLSGLSF
jgi:hypothetical protein